MFRRFPANLFPLMSVFLLIACSALPSAAEPPKLQVRYFGQANGVNRVGKPAEVTCLVRNLGTDPVDDLTATLGVPEGVKLLGPAVRKVDRVSPRHPRSFTWSIESTRPGPISLSVKIEGPAVAPENATATIDMTETPNVPKSDYVPEPRPVPCKYDLGAFYFPGWDRMAKWSPILDYPARKPVLGWYDEANPECVDWQIKWAVEHGIRFFMVDWYWSQGQRHLEHWLHKGFMNAKHRRYLKWCVMWANHNAPGSHTADDWRKVTQYWIDNYFGMEEYYRIDDRPAVVMWSPSNIRRDLGGTEQAAKLYAMSQEMAKKAGYKGIYFVAVYPRAHTQLKAEGYAGTTDYHVFQLAHEKTGSKQRFSFEDVVRHSPEAWRLADQRAKGLDYLPVIETGWSNEPWAGEDKALVIEGRTPERFGRLCRLAREYADKHDKKIITIAPLNEWGEGSYIEPYAQFGFGDLDALRAAFCEPGDYPPNLIPSDVGLGPYDLPMPSKRTSWDFNTEGDLQGWTANSHLNAEVRGGVLRGRSINADPILQVAAVRIEAQDVRQLVVRIKSDTPEHAQFFWSTHDLPWSERTSVRFDVPGDGAFHDCVVDLAKHPDWRGRIITLRLDPVSRPGATFEIDAIRLR